MSNGVKHLLWVLALYALCLIVALWPMQFEHMLYRPVLPFLLISYLVLYRPDLINLWVVVAMGVVYDAFVGNVFGQHSLAFVVAAYVTSLLYQRIKMFGAFQQTAVIFVIVGIGQIVVNWSEAVINGQTHPKMLAPAITTALCWPLAKLVFDSVLAAGWRLGEEHD